MGSAPSAATPFAAASERPINLSSPPSGSTPEDTSTAAAPVSIAPATFRDQAPGQDPGAGAVHPRRTDQSNVRRSLPADPLRRGGLASSSSRSASSLSKGGLVAPPIPRERQIGKPNRASIRSQIGRRPIELQDVQLRDLQVLARSPPRSGPRTGPRVADLRLFGPTAWQRSGVSHSAGRAGEDTHPYRIGTGFDRGIESDGVIPCRRLLLGHRISAAMSAAAIPGRGRR